jgi:diadenosine tetraphosphate (Ap4A) HIT family hydrolase
MSFELHQQLKKDTYEICELPLSKLLLMNNKNFNWFILVPKVCEVREIIDLKIDDRAILFDEVCKIAEIVRDIYKPYKLNIANLGNKVEQLHIHIIARYKNDPLFPEPVWGSKLISKVYASHEVETIAKMIKQKIHSNA